MKFNKLILVFAFVILNNSMVIAVDENDSTGSVKICVQGEKTETKAYQGKKIVSQYMNLLNAVLVKFPTTTLRMKMAAERGQKIVDAIAKLSPIGVTQTGEPVYFESEALEYEYVKSQLDFVLAPVEKFMDDIKEHRSIVKNLLEYCLGEEKTKQSFIYKSFDVEGSFLVYFSKTIKTIPDLNAAATEFLIFFADVNASLSDAAATAYNKLLDKITANKKAAANKATANK
ncbi:MAG: hypothetical protein V1646_05200 [bacterium]